MSKNLKANINKDINYVGKYLDYYLESSIKDGDTVVDATVGNGNDLLKINSLLQRGTIYGFDIQDIAISNARDKVSAQKSTNDIELILDSHSNIHEHIETNIDLMVMNLGYLPGGEKSITTESETTIACIEKAMEMLNPWGKILIMAYPGHPSGRVELDNILEYTATICQREYNVVHIRMANQINHPPELIVLERKND